MLPRAGAVLRAGHVRLPAGRGQPSALQGHRTHIQARGHPRGEREWIQMLLLLVAILANGCTLKVSPKGNI